MNVVRNDEYGERNDEERRRNDEHDGPGGGQQEDSGTAVG